MSLLHHGTVMQFTSCFSASGFSLATLALISDKLGKKEIGEKSKISVTNRQKN